MNELEKIIAVKAEVKALEENKSRLQQKIDNLFNAYIAENNEEPLYVCCCIKYLDDSSQCDVTMKLNNELDIQDDSLFYYCSSLNDLKSLCETGMGDFILTDVYEFSNEI